MEANVILASAMPPSRTAKNHSHNHHHHDYYYYHHSHEHHNHHSRPQPHNERHENLPSTYIPVLILPIFIIVFVLAIFLLIVRLRRLESAKNHSSTTRNNEENSRSCMFLAHPVININGTTGNARRAPVLEGVQVFTYKELEVATDKFCEANVIGNGGSGVVYRGTLSDGTMAAVKRLHREGRDGERAFRTEVDLLSSLRSPYLVELFGYCADQNHRLLIFELMSNGSLQHHLHPSPNQSWPLNWGTRLRIALDCARALEFLHEHTEPSVIHRDFNACNILLDQNFRAKVSDFGLAKLGSDKINGQISTHVVGTTGYVAPEYASTGKLTTKSDVYSYGVVLLELLTGRVPIDTSRPPGEHVLVSWALPRLTNREKVVEMIDPSLKAQYSKKELVQVAAIAAMCVQTEPDYRPLMTDVVQSLIPLVKNLSSVHRSRSFRYSKVSPNS